MIHALEAHSTRSTTPTTCNNRLSTHQNTAQLCTAACHDCRWVELHGLWGPSSPRLMSRPSILSSNIGATFCNSTCSRCANFSTWLNLGYLASSIRVVQRNCLEGEREAKIGSQHSGLPRSVVQRVPARMLPSESRISTYANKHSAPRWPHHLGQCPSCV